MRILLLGTTAIYAGLTAGPSFSQVWTNDSGSFNWGEAGNWDSGTVPDSDAAAVEFSGADADATVQLSDGVGGTTYTANTLDIQAATQLAGGTLILDGIGAALSYSGDLVGDVLADSLSLQLNASAAFTLLANFTSAAEISATDDVTLDVSADTGTDATFSGVLEDGSGTLSLEVSGPGTVALEADNTYTGSTSVTDGTLDVSGSLASTEVSVGGSGRLETDGGALAAGTDLDNDGTVVLGGSETIQSLNGTGDLEVTTGSLSLTSGTSDVDGVVSGNGGLTVAGGDVTLSGNNTYTGATDVTSGTRPAARPGRWTTAAM
ncbi:autotransporter-associated beta strand repeat-containing protein [Epibacterium sp. MM17-32]|uniref:autotransporter-associated beta strand repeat-containing protein n=1 Tax=Epibacterium sp. MM17-32 TaxID=2917734 RepID=UPI001EF620AA|nr:autotransporter-associated beta strand repeat-containing protein [Epibacterium sp. MM17-32]MCG7630464.1 autotransporter-associated beta strand repeat-containing protein [Epibacterium sp. MM17-32]